MEELELLLVSLILQIQGAKKRAAMQTLARRIMLALLQDQALATGAGQISQAPTVTLSVIYLLFKKKVKTALMIQ
jgi:hypothetical protein